MNCEELSMLLPDLVDGTLPAALQVEAQAALARCPDCQREFAVARQIRTFLVGLQAEHLALQVPADFERKLLARIQEEQSGVELLDLSSQTFGQWLLELLNLIGGLLGPGSESGWGTDQMAEG